MMRLNDSVLHSPGTSAVILAEQQTVARNPPLVVLSSERNLTVMVLAVTGPGMDVPENVWVVDPLLI